MVLAARLVLRVLENIMKITIEEILRCHSIVNSTFGVSAASAFLSFSTFGFSQFPQEKPVKLLKVTGAHDHVTRNSCPSVIRVNNVGRSNCHGYNAFETTEKRK